MRMWLVDPKLLCRAHLLGEHRELHTLEGCLKKGKNIAGFLKKDLVFPSYLHIRHRELVAEMGRRGYKHQSDVSIDEVEENIGGMEKIVEINIKELHRRCENCRKIQDTQY